MKERIQRENKKESRQEAVHKWMLTALCLFFMMGSRASAAQARLVSASAAVHESTDENSSAVGNLVQGNTFELHERVTTEAGETWYLITMSNGIQGYIRGEVSEENGEGAAEANNPEAQPEPEAPADTPPDNAPGDGVAAEGNAPEGNAEDSNPDEEGASPEEEPDENGEGVSKLPPLQNTQQKTYSGKTDNRIRDPMPQIEEETVKESQESQSQKGSPIDKTLLLLILAVIFSAATVCYSHRKLKQQLLGSKRPSEVRKKRKSKRAKKKRTAREVKKWKNNSLAN